MRALEKRKALLGLIAWLATSTQAASGRSPGRGLFLPLPHLLSGGEETMGQGEGVLL